MEDSPSTSESSSTVRSPAQNRKSYNNETKLDAIAFAEKNSKEAAARKYNVAPKTIRDWCKRKSGLLSAPSKRKRLEGKIFVNILYFIF
jgi:transposase-like protein